MTQNLLLQGPVRLPERPQPTLALETSMEAIDGTILREKPTPIPVSEMIQPRFDGRNCRPPAKTHLDKLKRMSPACLDLVSFANWFISERPINFGEGPRSIETVPSHRGHSEHIVTLVYAPDRVGQVVEVGSCLASALYEDETAMVHFDCRQASISSDYLFGSVPPGYRGYRDGGAIPNQLLRRPESIILISNFEYADESTLYWLHKIAKGYDAPLQFNTRGPVPTMFYFDNVVFLLTTIRGSIALGTDSHTFTDSFKKSLKDARPEIKWENEFWALWEKWTPDPRPNPQGDDWHGQLCQWK